MREWLRWVPLCGSLQSPPTHPWTVGSSPGGRGSTEADSLPDERELTQAAQ